MRAENRDLDHPGGSPVSSFSPEMLPMEEFWVERGQAEGGAGRRPRQDGLAARAAAAGAWEAVTASGPQVPLAHESVPARDVALRAGGAGNHSLTLGNAYFGSFIRTKSLRR